MGNRREVALQLKNAILKDLDWFNGPQRLKDRDEFNKIMDDLLKFIDSHTTGYDRNGRDTL